MTAMHPPTDWNPWIAVLTLTAMEIVLGVDNIVFITIWWRAAPRKSEISSAASASRWHW
jgi:predicted tellurium resistance membrane protein TerC